MADLTTRRNDRDADATPAGTADERGATGPGLRVDGQDARAVRARLAPTSAMGDEAPVRLAPNGDEPALGDASEKARASGAAAGPGSTVRTQRQLLLDGEPVELGLVPDGGSRYRLLDGGSPSRVVLGPVTLVDGGRRRREVLVDGFRFEVDVEPERVAALRERAARGRAASAHSGPLEVRAIIPGRVVSVAVAAGDAIIAGEQLLVVEAMKMQNELRAPRDGTIERLAVEPGQTIEVGDLLVVIS
jgi:biotin carboxyl carrier protein